MKILVTGACGYKGSVLVPKLLAQGHDVVAVDAQWFGNGRLLEVASTRFDSFYLDVKRGDIRTMDLEKALAGIDTIIHLASVANDPCANLSPALTWDVIANGTNRLGDAAVRAGVKHFIYASSASVYGISTLPNVTEDTPPVPLTTYNQAKYVAERALRGMEQSGMKVTIVRPATVCGLSPAMRTDLVVNLLTMQALNRSKITVLGGKQHRPNIHIDDITDLYCWLLDRPVNMTLNAGGENMTVFDIAQLVGERTGAEVEIRESTDNRSYRLDSSLLASFGWTPKRSVTDAIREIVHAHNTGALIEDDHMSRVNWMRREGIA